MIKSGPDSVELYSFRELISDWIVKVVCCLAIIFSLLMFRRNPVFFSVVAAVSLVVLLFSGELTVKVTKDIIITKSASLAGLILRFRGCKMMMTDIHNIEISFQRKPDFAGITIAVFMSSMLNFQGTRNRRSCFIEVYKKDGSTEVIETWFSPQEIDEFIYAVKRLLGRTNFSIKRMPD